MPGGILFSAAGSENGEEEQTRMEQRTGRPQHRRSVYHGTQAQRQDVRRVRTEPPRSAPEYPPRSSRSASYRRYAAKKRKRRALRRLMYLAAGLLILAAGVLAVTQTDFFPIHGGEEEPAAPAAAAAEPTAEEAQSGFIVAVDPGHGGGDIGAEGVYFDEWEMTWKTADYLMDLLKEDDRFSPFMTTDGTEYEKASQRAANAVAGGAQLLISIHGNSGEDPSYAGFECYPVPPGRTYNAESLAFAQLIADGFGAANEKLRGQNGVRYIYYDANNEKQIYEVSDTTVHTDPTFTLLEECGCPAVLAEQCFITSPEDVDAFGDEDGCQAAAKIYYDAICSWYETYGQTS